MLRRLEYFKEALERIKNEEEAKEEESRSSIKGCRCRLIPTEKEKSMGTNSIARVIEPEVKPELKTMINVSVQAAGAQFISHQRFIVLDRTNWGLLLLEPGTYDLVKYIHMQGHESWHIYRDIADSDLPGAIYVAASAS